MAIFWDAPVTPDASTTYVRNVPVTANNMLLNLFGTSYVQNNEVDLAEVTITNGVARYRAFDGRIHVSDRDVFSTSRVRMAPFSDSRNEGEYERLQIQFARTAGTRYGALEAAAYDDYTVLTRNMHNRAELALGDTLVDGKFTMGLDTEWYGETDYGVDAGNLPTAPKSWLTDTTADMLTDLIGWCDAYEAVNGTRPASVLTSRAVVRSLTTDTGLINAVKGAQTGVTRISLADLTNLFVNEGIPTEWRIDEGQFSVDGTYQRVLPANVLTFLPQNPSDLMEFRMGVSATALELVNSNESDMTFENAAGLVGLIEKVGPPYRQFAFIDAVGLPVVKNARLLFTAKVG